MKFRVMSFNVQHCLNYISREIDYDLFVETIRRMNPDIVGLNEVYSDGPAVNNVHQVKKLAEALGYHYYFGEATVLHNGSHYGNGLMSRYPLVEATTVAVPNPVHPAYDGYYEPRCVIKAKVDLAGGVTVMVSHFGLNPDEAENAVAAVSNQLPGEKTVLMGDFNVTPDNPVLLPIRERMKDTADLFEQPLLSFPSDAPDCKIDYVFCTPDLTVDYADIPGLVVSDHRPYVADLIVE